MGLDFGKCYFILEYQGCRIWTGRSHIGGGHDLSPGSWIVLPRSCQDSFLYVFFLLCVFPIIYKVVWLPCTIMGLTCLLYRSCMLMGLMQSHVWSCTLTESLRNSSCIVLVVYSSVMHVCPSRVTQSHEMHSATGNIVWFCQDSPTRCPVGVPGMVEQPQYP